MCLVTILTAAVLENHKNIHQPKHEVTMANLSWYMAKTLYLLITRVHNKRMEGEYSTLMMHCTNTLHEVCAVNHQVLSFYINNVGVVKDSMVSVNSFVVLCIYRYRYCIIRVRKCNNKKPSNEFNGWSLTTT